MSDPAFKNKSEEISVILENVWELGKLTPQEEKVFEDCIQTPIGRKIFRGQLNKYRISHRKMLEPKSFNIIKKLFWQVLDKICENRKSESHNNQREIPGRSQSFFEDSTRERIETCMDLMIMSETF